MKPIPEILPFVAVYSPDLGAVVVHVPVDSGYTFSDIEIADDEIILTSTSGERHVLEDASSTRVLFDGDHPVFVEHSDIDGEGFSEICYGVRRAVATPSFGS